MKDILEDNRKRLEQIKIEKGDCLFHDKTQTHYEVLVTNNRTVRAVKVGECGSGKQFVTFDNVRKLKEDIAMGFIENLGNSENIFNG